MTKNTEHIEGVPYPEDGRDEPSGFKYPVDEGRRRVGIAEAKAGFSTVVEGVRHRGERYVIERRGRPVAALVSVDDFERLERERASAAAPERDWMLSLVGILPDVADEEIDELVAHLRAERDRDFGRPPPDFGPEFGPDAGAAGAP